MSSSASYTFSLPPARIFSPSFSFPFISFPFLSARSDQRGRGNAIRTSFSIFTLALMPSTAASFWLSSPDRTASLYWPLRIPHGRSRLPSACAHDDGLGVEWDRLVPAARSRRPPPPPLGLRHVTLPLGFWATVPSSARQLTSNSASRAETRRRSHRSHFHSRSSFRSHFRALRARSQLLRRRGLGSGCWCARGRRCSFRRGRCAGRVGAGRRTRICGRSVGKEDDDEGVRGWERWGGGT